MASIAALDWRNLTLGEIVEFFFSDSRLDVLLAWVAITGAAASFVSGVAAVIVAFLGFRLSRQTLNLQKEATDQRKEFQEEQRKSIAAHQEWEARAKVEARRTMTAAQAASDQQRARVIAEHAWFEIECADTLGQKWKITNVGRCAAGHVKLSDDTAGGVGVWTLDQMHPFSLDAGESAVFTFFPHPQPEICALVKVAWMEYGTPEEPQMNDLNGLPLANVGSFAHDQLIMIEFKFGEDEEPPMPEALTRGVTGYPIPLV